MREAEGRLGPGNLEPKAAKRLECRAHGAKRSAQTRNTGPPKARPVRRRKYAGPYPRAAKGEGAGEAGEHGANPEAAKRLEPRGHGAKRSPQGRNTAQALAQGGAKVWDDHAELRTLSALAD